MITIQTILSQLTGEEIYTSLIQMMAEEFDDFDASWRQYDRAISILQAELGDDLIINLIESIQQMTVSNLLFSGVLGIKANLDNYINPVARNFLDVDPDIYLREDTAHRLPKYDTAHKVLERFYAQLTSHQQVLYEDIIRFTSHLETLAPKLAHYYGYLLGNELLPRIIPGYHADMALTMRYRMMLGDYFGKGCSLPVE